MKGTKFSYGGQLFIMQSAGASDFCFLSEEIIKVA